MSRGTQSVNEINLGMFELIGSQLVLIFNNTQRTENMKERIEIFEYLLNSKIIKMYCDCSTDNITPEALADTYYRLLLKNNLV